MSSIIKEMYERAKIILRILVWKELSTKIQKIENLNISGCIVNKNVTVF